MVADDYNMILQYHIVMLSVWRAFCHEEYPPLPVSSLRTYSEVFAVVARAMLCEHYNNFCIFAYQMLAADTSLTAFARPHVAACPSTSVKTRCNLSGMIEAEAEGNQHWVRRSVRAAGSSALDSAHVVKLLDQIRYIRRVCLSVRVILQYKTSVP